MTAADYSDRCRRLLRATGASRVTLRLADESGFPALVAEEAAPGVPSMRSGSPINPADYPTYRHLVETGDLLVQSDTRTHPIRPPASLIDEMRVYAQILAPIRRDGRTVGTVSVHIQDHPRHFTAADVAAVRDFQQYVEAGLAG
ncbi:GAF domain-containing protein [Nocardia sp. alder85J]|uniref:GAF domain-containing protein n=1 Tax=Nocardia sp. alder85J TaxID=2862949 RepID=UPI001CD78D78|nr:GAF domain-containing protein [Nocardia sp. alder85J]MCX4095482.1 GAF domain-containing protein [Nocardia sp. alder85J]